MQDPTITEAYPGVTRLRYFLITLAVGFVYGFTAVVAGINSTTANVAYLVLLAGCFIANVARVRNIGLSQWWAFLSVVPLVNSFFGIFILAAQSGWIKTRRFDRAGKIILCLYAGLFLLGIGVALMLYLNFAGPALHVN